MYTHDADIIWDDIHKLESWTDVSEKRCNDISLQVNIEKSECKISRDTEDGSIIYLKMENKKIARVNKLK